MKKKTDIRAWIIIVILALAIYSYYYKGGRASLIEDHMEYYDDCTGLRLDKWTYHSWYKDAYTRNDWYDTDANFIIDGTIHLPGTYSGASNADSRKEIISKQKFATEDITVKYGYCSYHLSDIRAADARIQYGTATINIPESLVKTTSAGNYYKSEGLVEIKRYDDLDLSKFVIIINGQEIGTGTNDIEEGEVLQIVGGGGSSEWCGYDGLVIDEVKFEPYFSCEIDYTTEVIVRDKFSAGSVVSLNLTTYTPLKFCPQDLGVLIFSEEGLTDEKGSITERIAKGETLVVPDDQYWQFDYVTKYVTDMKERCGVGEAYSTDLLQCVDVAGQQIPTPTLLYCETDADCILPSQCYDASVRCVNNQCDYYSVVCTPEQIINYVETIRTLDITVPQILLISTGLNQVSFSEDKAIAGYSFTSTKPIVTSQCLGDSSTDWGYIQGDGCYNTKVTWGPYKFNISNGETLEISPHIFVKYLMTGKGAYYGDKTVYDETAGEKITKFFESEFILDEDWTNNFVITFKDIFEMEIVEYKEKVSLGETPIFKIKIKNNIFDLPDAGFNLKLSKLLRDIYLPTISERGVLASGWHEYSIPMQADEIGLYVGELTPFFVMMDDTPYLGKEQVVFGYYVATQPEILDCHQTGCVVGDCLASGVCSVSQDNFIDCNDIACPIGVCDSGSGNCIVYKTAEPVADTPDAYELEGTTTPTQIEPVEVTRTLGEESKDTLLIALIIIAGILLVIFLKKGEFGFLKKRKRRK